MAKSYACRQAQLHRICLSNITDFVCVDSGYSQVITASGGFLALPGQVDNWQIVAGGLPAGLTFNGGTVQGGAVSITGTPTEIGIFSFTVQITAPNGDMMQKPYTLTVAGIVNADALPDGTVGTAYTAQLVAVGFVNPLFSIVAGTLPDGLTMDGTGLISGTPTTDEVDTLTFGVEENP